jgi:hypothetical protein
MKHIILCTILITTAGIARAESRIPVHSEQVAIEQAGVPEAPTRSESVVVMVAGQFPNTCYHWLGAEVNHVTEMIHEVRAVATVLEANCMMVLVPFREDINLGKLPSGVHTIRFYTEGDEYFERSLTIL